MLSFRYIYDDDSDHGVNGSSGASLLWDAKSGGAVSKEDAVRVHEVRLLGNEGGSLPYTRYIAPPPELIVQ